MIFGWRQRVVLPPYSFGRYHGCLIALEDFLRVKKDYPNTYCEHFSLMKPRRTVTNWASVRRKGETFVFDIRFELVRAASRWRRRRPCSQRNWGVEASQALVKGRWRATFGSTAWWTFQRKYWRNRSDQIDNGSKFVEETECCTDGKQLESSINNPRWESNRNKRVRNWARRTVFQ